MTILALQTDRQIRNPNRQALNPGHPVDAWSYDNNLKTYDTSTCLGQQGFAALRDASLGQPC
jgi:hypothetical protein